MTSGLILKISALCRVFNMRLSSASEAQGKSCLYVTYDGLLDPLGQSQILPYIKGLAAEGHCFTILSFEKTERLETQIKTLRKDLEIVGIQWIALPFKKGKLEYIKRIIKGAWKLNVLARRYRPALVHARTILPASMVVLSGVKAPLIYDIRAFAGEWIEAGRLRQNSLQARLFQRLEKHLITRAAGLVVLDSSGAEYLRQCYPYLRSPIRVIPTSTNINPFPLQASSFLSPPKPTYRFVFLGGARFPYRPDLALLLIKQLLREGIVCSIDFINERDHEVIKTACTDLALPSDYYRIFALPQNEIPSTLASYHSGFVFNTSGRWRRMSSPTKLGEYLAAGLHVMGLSGIHALDRLAAEDPAIVELFDESEITQGLPHTRITKLLNSIQSLSRSSRARQLASKHYDLRVAVRVYSELYRIVLR